MRRKTVPSTTQIVSHLIVGFLLISCTKKMPETQTPTGPALPAASVPTKTAVLSATTSVPKDKIIQGIIRVFEQADSIHREAWWVVGGERRSSGKSPFGKVQRALMSDQNIKLSNKSFFRCDRYVVKRDVLSATGIPQSAEVFEKCSEKTAAKKIAYWSLEQPGQLKVTFVAENMEEVLGTGATILLRLIECRLGFNEQDQLTLFSCKSWAQDRSQTQVVRLDTYEYKKDAKSLLKLQGKVYENLTELRKIDVSIPMEGKIKVTETELYAPEEVATPTPTPVVTPAVTPKSAPGQATDPDVMAARKRAQERAVHGLPPWETPEEKALREQATQGQSEGSVEHPEGQEPEGPPGILLEHHPELEQQNQPGQPQTGEPALPTAPNPNSQELPRAR